MHPTTKNEERAPRVAYILPRRAAFYSQAKADSVSLCVRDLARYSRFAAQTTVFCPEVTEPFDDGNVRFLPPYGRTGVIGQVYELSQILARERFDIAIVQQHLPSASLGMSRAMLK